MAVTDKEYGILSNAVYHDDKTYIDPVNCNGFQVLRTMSNDKNGSYAQAFVNKDNEVVIAFRGTDNTLNATHAAEYIATGNVPPEFGDGLQFARDIQTICENSNPRLTFVGMTGHSLGGGDGAVRQRLLINRR